MALFFTINENGVFSADYKMNLVAVASDFTEREFLDEEDVLPFNSLKELKNRWEDWLRAMVAFNKATAVSIYNNDTGELVAIFDFDEGDTIDSLYDDFSDSIIDYIIKD